MENRDIEKYIGIVKWFHDKMKNANYGFIQHNKLGEVFFHEKSIDQDQILTSFKENEVVVFFSMLSKKHIGKSEAFQVRLLSTENDLYFIFNNYLSILLEKGKNSDYNIIQKKLKDRIKQLLTINENLNISNDLFNSFKKYILVNLDLSINKNILQINEILNICKDYFSDKYFDILKIIESNISPEIAHKLWLENRIETCQIEYISDLIIDYNKDNQRIIFNRCSEEDKSNIFFCIVYKFKKIDSDYNLERIKKLLNLAKEFAFEHYEKIINEVLKICPSYYKLNLWLDDYHQILEFDEYKLYTITLNPNNQKKFVKKVLKYIHEEKIKIPIEQLTSINTIDYATSKLAEKIDNSKLDFSTSVILNTIYELNSKFPLETKKNILDAKFRIYDIILDQIKDPNDILQIDGYFDKCEGRCFIKVREMMGNEGKIITENIVYERNEKQKAKLHPFCDGRKATIKTTEDTAEDENGIEFWWCANQKCYKPSRVLHKSDEWEKYTLLDFLTILKVPFMEKDFEIYLNLINKANSFLKHMICRECNQILKPKKKSNYAFYGINDFHCTNEGCKENGKIIYLTHCLNGKCEQEIDSRDAVKCKPIGFESDNCGWYVCNYCHSCCSDEVIQRRIYILKQTGQKYCCHTHGHRNLGVICCNKCGYEMESKEIDEKKYENVLKWFDINKDKSKYIKKHGLTKKNKIWFRFEKNDLSTEEYYSKLYNLLSLGFIIPNIEERKDIQLISEPSDTQKMKSGIFKCKNCDNYLDLSNDLEKAFIVKSFHNVRFKEWKILK